MITALLFMALIGLIIILVRARNNLDRERQRSMALQQQLTAAAQSHGAALDLRAQRAVSASRGSFNGHIAQQAFPYAPGKSYQPKDIFHLGGVMDYIVFDGLDEIRNGGRDPGSLSVVLVDVKWGSSRPAEVQKAVIAAMNQGHTRGEIWHARESTAGGLTYRRTAP